LFGTREPHAEGRADDYDLARLALQLLNCPVMAKY
jgi:hypothetical protein